MTNNGLKAFIDEFGSKIFMILMDNNHKVFMGTDVTSDGNYNDASTLELKTFGDVDMFRVKHVDRTWHHPAVKDGIAFSGWLVTGCIQAIYVSDDDSPYLPDLNKFF